MDDLICKIKSLLELGYEGGYWDFKSDYPDKNKKEDKLHDIICMANNLEDRDAYLIYGANDDGTIKGIQNTEKQRLKTADFIKFLRDKNFAGGFIPDVELQTIVIDDNELDILIIRRGKHTPYYLQKDYYESSPKEKLRAGAIYTRTADINTPKECTARRISNSKEQFYYSLIENERLKDMKIFNVLKEKYMDFYNVCEKFADISLNAPKYRVPGTCEVQGYFQFKDIERAKRSAKAFFADNSLKNVDEYMLAIRTMYRLAVDFNDSRCLGGIVKPENADSSYGSFGTYYNFAEMPSNIWQDVEKETKEFIQNP